MDRTLLLCWPWAKRPGLYFDKHKKASLRVQVACTIYGELAWTSDPIDGSRHDNFQPGESDVMDTLTPGNWIGADDTSGTT